MQKQEGVNAIDADSQISARDTRHVPMALSQLIRALGSISSLARLSRTAAAHGS